MIQKDLGTVYRLKINDTDHKCQAIHIIMYLNSKSFIKHILLYALLLLIENKFYSIKYVYWFPDIWVGIKIMNYI